MSTIELENVLQQMFMECDASMSVSTPDSTISIGDEVPVFKIVQYVQDQLPTWSTDDLAEFWKCLAAVSSNDRVNMWQFKEATKCWITKMQQIQSSQDNNNNAREKLYLVSDTDLSMKDMDINRDIVEFELRAKLRELHEENIFLREELERHETSIDNFRQQCNIAERQLDRYAQKCQQLEKENDEQRDQLNEAIKNGKATALALHRYTKEHQNLSRQLEAAEIEVQVIPSLKCKVEKISKEKMDCMKQIARLQEKFDETENECKQLKVTIAELEEINIKMRETYDQTIHNLRERNCQLTEENTELQSLSILNRYSPGERLSISSIPDIDGCCTHSTPYKSRKILLQDSLYAELKASGFVAECSRYDLYRQELDEYDAAISTILEQLEKVVQIFGKTRSSIDDIPQFSSQDMNAGTCNIETLKHKVTLLLNMATEEITKKSTKDSSTQLRTDLTNEPNDDLNQFGIMGFRDLLLTRAYRSVHTLRSQSLQSPSPTVEDSRRQTSSCQSSRTDSPDACFAQGDFCLTRENCNEKLFAMEPHGVSDKENLTPKRSSEMPKILSVLQMDSTALAATSEEEKTNANIVQEIIGTSNPTSPRRKISVYCRSFDVVTVQDSCEDRQRSGLEIRRSSSNPDDSSARIDERFDPEIVAENLNSTPKYPFNYNYRNTKNDSDSSNDSSPQKQFQDNLLEDESPIEQPVLRKVYLAPTRLRFSQEIKKKLNETACSPSDSIEPNISNSLLFPIVDNGREEDDDALRSSATFIIDKCETEIEDGGTSKPYSANENFLRECSTSARRLFPCNHSDSRKITDSGNPHSQASVQRVESEPRVERSVDGQMSSREDSSDSECEPVAESSDQCTGEKVDGAALSTSLNSLASAKIVPCKSVAQKNTKTCNRDLLNVKQGKRQRLLFARRSFSESESSARSRCRCRYQESAPLILEGDQCKVFPSLTDIRLQESGIANLSDTNSRENLSELELQKRYIVFSLCLCTDRVTLSRRVAMSLRQRDQSERNFSCEVQKMQQDIQDLAPLCTDRESVERVERVRHQLDMIVRCTHRVSCAAETLGAVYQEHRVSQAVQLADRYLRLLQSRCEKLIADVAETKRILIENNIVIEENSSELCDDLPRIRYRSGTPANNRMMMARRRASVATMSRPIGSTQDVTKDTIRQRNSVSGRMTLRRPSFNSESPKWEIEKLDRTDSSNSMSELRGIFEQTESRRSSREENNNKLRLRHSNSQNIMNCTVGDSEIWTSTKQQTFEFFADDEDVNIDAESCTRSSQYFLRSIPWRTMLWSIIIFFLGFFMNQVMVNACNGPLHGWSIEHILSRHIYKITNAAPHPM
ncbi:Inositol 1,4,5-triphosphate receptor associated 2 [Formica fusca]